MFFPKFVCFVIWCHAVFLIAAKHGNIELVLVYLHHFRKELPTPSDSLFLEIIAERPVAHHLEHGVMIGVATHFFEVVVLSRNPQAFLYIGDARSLARVVSQEDILELVHAGVGEHQSRVIFHNNRC